MIKRRPMRIGKGILLLYLAGSGFWIASLLFSGEVITVSYTFIYAIAFVLSSIISGVILIILDDRRMVASNVILNYLLISSVILLIVSFPIPSLTLNSVLMVAFSVMLIQSTNTHGRPRYFSYISVILFLAMLLIGGLLKYNLIPGSTYLIIEPVPLSIFHEIPYIFYGGAVAISEDFTLTLSPQMFIIFFLISYVLMDNYHLILRSRLSAVKGTSGGSETFSGVLAGAVSSVGCQCETITAALPSVASLFLASIVTPLVLVSVILLLLTNALIRMNYLVNGRKIFSRLTGIKSTYRSLFLSASAASLVLVLSTIGIAYGLQKNLLFIGPVNLATFATFFAFFVSLFSRLRWTGMGIRMPLSLSVTIFTVSTLFMFTWIYPPVTSSLVVNPGIYNAVSSLSIVGGFLYAILFMSLSREWRIVLLELLSMMVTMFALAIFFLSLYDQYVIWPTFSLYQQLYFSIILWVASLPVMWVFTNISIMMTSQEHSKERVNTRFA